MALTVTSPPFLDVVDYTGDNWLRCWFSGLDAEAMGAASPWPARWRPGAGPWRAVFEELYRLTQPGGFVAFEVGEIRRGKVKPG